MLEALSTTGNLVIAGHAIGSARFMQALYGPRRYAPIWTSQRNVEDLVTEIGASIEDGLTPDDFHDDAIQRWHTPEGLTPEQRAGRDILFTDALVRLGYQLYYGKVDPTRLDATWNLDRPLLTREPAEEVAEALRDEAIPAFIDSIRPPLPEYEELRQALARQRTALQAPRVQVAPGPALRRGDNGARVATLRDRLGLPDGDAFDAQLDDAVRAFQARRHLVVDGIVGGDTLAALNAGPQQRIDTLRVNLERARWMRVLPVRGRFVAVNIAGFEVYLVEDDEIVWRSRAIVGLPYRKTPLFTGDMTYLVLNPTWTPTRTIIRNSLLPKQRQDPGYLAVKGFTVYDGSGQRIDPAAADWANPGQYRIVQGASETNALGRVKFMFPNRYAIYLHDTPQRDLFGESRRTFSQGCIRVERPIELAERLLADQPDWQSSDIETTLASGATKTIHLTAAVPVYLLYWTADPMGEGEGVEFLPDIYERDPAVLKALDAVYRPLDF